MNKEKKKLLLLGGAFLVAFIFWTALLVFLDVKEIGPRGSSVGLASLNGAFHKLTGVNMLLYNITDWLGLVPIAVAFSFALLGLVQWIKRKSILAVDRDILVLGGYYLLLILVYVLFESLHVNYRPVLIDGYLEASYPSSTTMLVTCIMPTAAVILCRRIKERNFKRLVVLVIAAFTLFTVIGRIVSGVHWITDIIGGLLFSAAFFTLYVAATVKSKE